MTGVALFRISQPKPEAQFEPKKKLGTHQCSRHHPRPRESRTGGSELSCVHSLLLINGNRREVHLHPGIVTMNLSHNLFLRMLRHQGMPSQTPSPLSFSSWPWIKTRAELFCSCQTKPTREIEEGRVHLDKVSSTSQSVLTDCYL